MNNSYNQQDFIIRLISINDTLQQITQNNNNMVDKINKVSFELAMLKKHNKTESTKLQDIIDSYNERMSNSRYLFDSFAANIIDLALKTNNTDQSA